MNRKIEPLVKSLNKHGDLFRKKVAHELRSHTKVESITEEVPVNKSNGRAIDIVVFLKTDRIDKKLVLLIECKKVNASELEWVFLQTDTQIQLTACTTVEGLNNPRLKINNFPCSIDGYEWKTASEHKLNKDSISSAVIQAVDGFNYFLNDLYDQSNLRGLKNTLVVMPMIITNAKLSTLKLDPKNIDLKLGTITSDKIEIEPISHLILRANSKSPSVTQSGQMQFMQDKNSGILIANTDAIHNLLDLLTIENFYAT